MHVEMPQHVKDSLEPEVLDMTLAILIQGQPQMLKERKQAGSDWFITRKHSGPSTKPISPEHI